MALQQGYFVHPEIQVVKTHLSLDDIVMEVGAGIGVVSSFCAKRVGSKRVFAYEGNPSVERLIRHTYRLNGVSPTLEMCLIGGRAGMESFGVAENFWSSSTIRRPGTEVMKVPMKPFNVEIQRPDPTFLVVDIEGAEYELCRCADFHHVRKVVMEVHEDIIGRDSIDSIISRLRSAGLTLHEPSSYPTVLFFQRP
jgi:FkbM family methyltransferase